MNTYLPALPNLTDEMHLIKMYRGPTDTSNWLVRGRIMVGSSPGTHLNQTLKYSKKNASKELKILRDKAGITVYVSFQQVSESLKFKPMYQTLLKKIYVGTSPIEDEGEMKKSVVANSNDKALSPSSALIKHRNPNVLNKEHQMQT